jgi:Domain of unknown function (DUF4258)
VYWTQHARDRAYDRNIDESDAEWVVTNGHYHAASNANPANRCHIGWVGNSRLVVVTNGAGTRVITVYWD